LVWTLTLVGAFVALFVPWYLRVLDIDIAPIAWLVAGATSVHLLAAPALANARSVRVRHAALLCTHLIGLMVLAVIWVRLGTFEVPLFLLFFAAPMATAGIVLRVWERLIATFVALAVILLAAALCSSALRWYAEQLGLPLEWLGPLARRVAVSASSASSVALASACVSLLLTAVALPALVICASSLAGAVRRIDGRSQALITALRQEESLAQEILRSSPLSEAIVLPESGQLVLLNDRFRSEFITSGERPADASLRDLLKLEFPEALDQLLRDSDGCIACTYHTSTGKRRSARIYVRQSLHEGARVARVSIEDCTIERQLEAAFDALDDLVVIYDANSTIVYANSHAHAAFPQAVRGVGADAALLRPELPDSWWRTPRGSSVPRRIVISGAEFRGTVRSSSETTAEPLTVIALTPVRQT